MFSATLSFPGGWEVPVVPGVPLPETQDTDLPYPCLGQVVGSKMDSAHFPSRLSPSGAGRCPLVYKAPSFMRCNSLLQIPPGTHHFITKTSFKAAPSAMDCTYITNKWLLLLLLGILSPRMAPLGRRLGERLPRLCCPLV